MVVYVLCSVSGGVSGGVCVIQCEWWCMCYTV